MLPSKRLQIPHEADAEGVADVFAVCLALGPPGRGVQLDCLRLTVSGLQSQTRESFAAGQFFHSLHHGSGVPVTPELRLREDALDFSEAIFFGGLERAACACMPVVRQRDTICGARRHLRELFKTIAPSQFLHCVAQQLVEFGVCEGALFDRVIAHSLDDTPRGSSAFEALLRSAQRPTARRA